MAQRSGMSATKATPPALYGGKQSASKSPVRPAASHGHSRAKENAGIPRACTAAGTCAKSRLLAPDAFALPSAWLRIERVLQLLGVSGIHAEMDFLKLLFAVKGVSFAIHITKGH